MCGACCTGCFLGAFLSFILTAVVLCSVSVITAAISYPVLKWASEHKVALGEVGTCLNGTVLRVNQTLQKRLPEKCFDLLCDKCNSNDLDPEMKEKCEECLCEAEYHIQKMQPPLEPQLLQCCKPLSKDKGTEFLVEICEDLVTNMTAELEKETEKCEKKNIIMSAQPLLLQGFVKVPKNFIAVPRASEFIRLLSWTPYLQGIAASILLIVGFASLAFVIKQVMLGKSRLSNVSLEEQLLS